jgi:hypothetical protein
MIIMVCDGSGLDQLSLVWQAVGRAVIRWTELAELKEGGQSSFQCVIQFLRLVYALGSLFNFTDIQSRQKI